MSYKQGDQVLIETAKLFRSYTREVDMVCRYGGDEFAILMPETSYEHALGKAENLRQVVRSAEFTNTQEPENPLRLTLSIGVTAWHAEIKNGDELGKRHILVHRSGCRELYGDGGRDAGVRRGNQHRGQRRRNGQR